MKYKNIAILLTLALAACSFSAWAESALKIADPFTVNMVLQQGMAAPAWGEAGPGAKVSVSFPGQPQTTVADSAGQGK
jgi:hypothetical protein